MKNAPTSPVEKLLIDINNRLDNIEKNLTKNHQPEFDWYEASDICERFRITKRTLDNYRQTGKIPHSKLGGRVYYRLIHFYAYLEQNQRINTKETCSRNPQGQD